MHARKENIYKKKPKTQTKCKSRKANEVTRFFHLCNPLRTCEVLVLVMDLCKKIQTAERSRKPAKMALQQTVSKKNNPQWIYP